MKRVLILWLMATTLYAGNLKDEQFGKVLKAFYYVHGLIKRQATQMTFTVNTANPRAGFAVKKKLTKQRIKAIQRVMDKIKVDYMEWSITVKTNGKYIAYYIKLITPPEKL